MCVTCVSVCHTFFVYCLQSCCLQSFGFPEGRVIDSIWHRRPQVFRKCWCRHKPQAIWYKCWEKTIYLYIVFFSFLFCLFYCLFICCKTKTNRLIREVIIIIFPYSGKKQEQTSTIIIILQRRNWNWGDLLYFPFFNI